MTFITENEGYGTFVMFAKGICRPSAPCTRFHFIRLGSSPLINRVPSFISMFFTLPQMRVAIVE